MPTSGPTDGAPGRPQQRGRRREPERTTIEKRVLSRQDIVGEAVLYQTQTERREKRVKERKSLEKNGQEQRKPGAVSLFTESVAFV